MLTNMPRSTFLNVIASQQCRFNETTRMGYFCMKKQRERQVGMGEILAWMPGLQLAWMPGLQLVFVHKNMC